VTESAADVDDGHPSLRDDPLYLLLTRTSKTHAERAAFRWAIWYCCHLPRTVHDFSRALGFGEFGNVEHSARIELLRYPSVFDPAHLPSLRRMAPTLIICPDEAFDDATRLSKTLDVPLSVTAFSSLNQQSLATHWSQFASLLPGSLPTPHPLPSLIPQLHPIDDAAATRLAWWILARQNAALFLPHPEELPTEFDEMLADLIIGNAQLRAVWRNWQTKGRPLSGDELDAAIDAETRVMWLPVVLGGIVDADNGRVDALKTELEHREHAAWQELGIARPDPSSGRDDFNMMVAHRTASIPRCVTPRTLVLPPSLFVSLQRLVAEYRRTPRNAKKIWWLLEKLGSDVADLFDDITIRVLRQAKCITVISDFPLGLAVLPGDSVPLQYLAPISYRPTNPLMGTAGKEMAPKSAKAYLQGGFRVLIAECIHPADPAFRASFESWLALRYQVARLPEVEVQISVVTSLDQFNGVLEATRPDILIISAHGTFDATSNQSELVIGNDRFAGYELVFMPRVVVLSACDTIQRASGAFSIIDVLLMAGAEVVLGAMIPVRVGHTGSLLGRLFGLMVAAIKGDLEAETLRDVWHLTHRSNVVADIVQCDPLLTAWGLRYWDEISDLVIEWEEQGRMTMRHVVRDSQLLLREFAEQCGIGDHYTTAVENKYVPESIFYMLCGRPERVVLRNDAEYASRKSAGRFSALGARLATPDGGATL
jgi:hypothetical protein